MSDDVIEKQVEENVETVETKTDDILNGYTEEANIPSESITVEHKEPEPKKKRGRPKGSGSKASKSRFTEKVEGNEIINGTLLIFFIDTAIPMAISFLNNRFSDEKVKASELQLTAAQKRDLQPIADEVAKQIAINGNPMTVFIISLVSIYAGNYISKKFG